MLVLVVAGVKIAGGLAVWIGSGAWQGTTPNLFVGWFYLLQQGVYCAAALFLLLGGRGDRRARSLGTQFALFGTVFSGPLLREAQPLLTGGWAAFAVALDRVEPIALAPAYLWQFAREFPRPITEPPLPVARQTPFVVLFAAGALMLGMAFVRPFVAEYPLLAFPAAWLTERSNQGHFWEILLVMCLPSLALIALNLRASPEVERRRVRLFLASLVIALIPLAVDIFLASMVTPYREFTREPQRLRVIAGMLSLALLVVPAVTVYAVLVHRIFDVRFFVRRALQYALARYTLTGLLIVPLAGLVSYLYANRQQPIVNLLGGRASIGWQLLAAGVVMLALARRSLLDSLDRRFFRERYDARRTLLDLVEGSRRSGSIEELAVLTVNEIDRALHVNTVSLLIRDPNQATFVDPQHQLRSLPIDGPLTILVGGAGTPLEVSASDSALGRLPFADQQWLHQAHVRLFVPLFASDRSLIGMFAIGDKLSEEPFSAEDRELLTSVATSTAMAVEHRQLLDSAHRLAIDEKDADEEPALQCSWCGIVQQAEAQKCHRCGGPIVPARLPAVLAGTFALERQVGRGGMGIVYRARDLKLDRSVALKTLPRVSGSSVNRLRQEALAMAALEDPHLAVIYGFESWRGSPVLVLEYLGGGTLDRRLETGPLPIAEVVRVGLAIASALEVLHQSGMLHRDIKPSNIGFTAAGLPKLLDFGLARLAAVRSQAIDLARSSASTIESDLTQAPADRGEARPAPEVGFLENVTRALVGTAAYLPPEAVAMESPTASFDLWGLAVTLFEATTGRNPFKAATVPETFRLISRPERTDPLSLRADCPPALAAFLVEALSPHRVDRPASARAFYDVLASVMRP